MSPAFCVAFRCLGYGVSENCLVLKHSLIRDRFIKRMQINAAGANVLVLIDSSVPQIYVKMSSLTHSKLDTAMYDFPSQIENSVILGLPG